ncbi:MAG: MinD/ParA family protein [Clostridium lundense]|nr:MinD/ParA family protein [Clostridium lundense]
MLDQAANLRKLIEQRQENKAEKVKKVPRIITITSGKGGVGKSNLVVNLGISLQRQGYKVMIFDADVGMGNDDVLMGHIPKYDIYDVIFKDMKISEVLVEGPFGIKLLPGGNGFSKIDEISDSQREEFIAKLREIEDMDFLLMDTGAGVNRDVLAFVACSEELILITTPEPTSLTDAYSLLKAVRHFKLKDTAYVVINKSFNLKESISTYERFKSTVGRFLNMELSYLGDIPEDRKLTEAVRKQDPVVISAPYSESAIAIKKIAEKLVGTSVSKDSASVKGLFKKLFAIFS